MSEKHQECSECGKPLAHRVHSPTYGTHAYREPVASPQATRHVIDHTTCINVEDEIEYMKWIDKRNAAQPVAGTTPCIGTFYDAGHPDMLICDTCGGIGSHSTAVTTPEVCPICCADRIANKQAVRGEKCPACSLRHRESCTCELCKPSEGTTPQAERPDDTVRFRERLKKISFLITGNDYAFLSENPEIEESLKVYVENVTEARAVAPVETPDAKVLWRERLKKLSFLITGNDYAFFAENPQIEESLKVYVESLNETAECAPDQTRLTAEQFYDNQDKFNFFPDESRGIGAIWAFAEAFRDKSEAELRAKLAEQEKERDLYALLRGICEEVIDWLGTLSYDGIDDAKSVLDHPLSKDIRLKLQQMYDHPLDNKLLIRTDVLEAKLERADAAEAEAAALRERCETFVEHTCTGSALCKECRKALSAAPERP